MSDALALGLGVHSPGGLVGGGPIDFWAKYPEIRLRTESRLNDLLTDTAVQFDGQNWLRVEEQPFDAGPMTFFGWVRLPNIAEGQTIMYAGNSGSNTAYMLLRTTSSGTVSCEVREAAGQEPLAGTVNIHDDSWHFVMFSYSAGTLRMRLDKTEDITRTTINSILPTYNRLTLGVLDRIDPLWYSNGAHQAHGLYAGPVMSAAQYDFLWNDGKGITWSQLLGNNVGLDPAEFYGWWPCDETQGVRMNWGSGFGANALNLIPGSGGGALPSPTDGHIQTVPTGVGVTEDTALSSDGDGDANHLVTNPLSIGVTGYPWSLSVWVRGQPISSTAHYFVMWNFNGSTNNQPVAMHMWGNTGSLPGRITVRFREGGGDDNALISNGRVDDGQWHHLLVVWTSSLASIYIDGVFDNSLPHSEPFAATANQLMLFKYSFGAGNAWDFDLDECVFYDADMSSVAGLIYNGGDGIVWDSPSQPPGRVNHYPLDDNHPTGPGVDVIGGQHLGVIGNPVGVTGIPAGQNVTGAVPITLWRNKSADKDHLPQNTFADRPLLVAVEDGTGWAIECDGVSQFMQLTSWADGDAIQPNVVFCLYEPLEIASGDIRLICDSSDPARSFQGQTTSGQFYTSAGVNLTSGVTAVIGERKMLVSVFNGANSEFYINGGAPAAEGNAGTNAIRGFTIGAERLLSTFTAGRYRINLVNDGILTREEIDDIAQHYDSEWNFGWTEIGPGPQPGVDPVVWYDFTETSGITKNSAVDFTDVTRAIRIELPAPLVKPYAVSALHYKKAGAASGYVVSVCNQASNSFYGGLDSITGAGSLRAIEFDGTTRGAAAPDPHTEDTWALGIANFPNDSLREASINGSAFGQNTATVVMGADMNRIGIGRLDRPTNTLPTNGYAQGVGLWNDSITQEESAWMWNNGAPKSLWDILNDTGAPEGLAAKLIGYWALDEQPGGVYMDAIGGNHGVEVDGPVDVADGILEMPWSNEMQGRAWKVFDKSPAGGTMIQNDVIRRGLITSTGLFCDTIDDFYETLASFNIPQPYTMFVAFLRHNELQNAYDTALGGGDTRPTEGRIGVNVADEYEVDAGTPVDLGMPTVEEMHVISFIADGVSSVAAIDRFPSSVVNAGTQGISGKVRIGSDYLGEGGPGMTIAEILIYDRRMSDAEFDAKRNEIANRQGVPVP